MKIKIANCEEAFYFNNMVRSYLYMAEDSVDNLEVQNTLTLTIQNPEPSAYEETIAFFENADISNIDIYNDADKKIMGLKGQTIRVITQNISNDFNTIQINIGLQ